MLRHLISHTFDVNWGALSERLVTLHWLRLSETNCIHCSDSVPHGVNRPSVQARVSLQVAMNGVAVFEKPGNSVLKWYKTITF